MYALNGLGVASASDLGAFWNRKRRRGAPRPIAKKIVGRGHPGLLTHAKLLKFPKPLKLQFRRPATQPDPRMTPEQRAKWDRMTPTQQAALARLQRSWDEARQREEQASTSGLGDATTMVGGVLAVGAVAAAAYFLFGKQLGLKKNPRKKSGSKKRGLKKGDPVLVYDVSGDEWHAGYTYEGPAPGAPRYVIYSLDGSPGARWRIAREFVRPRSW